MKFAKELEQELVPEWRAKYLEYKQGKKLIKSIARAVARVNATPTSSGKQHYRSNGSPYATHKKAPHTIPRRPLPRNNIFALNEENSQPNSDDSDQLRKPILAKKRQDQRPPQTHYGSFVPTPTSEFQPEQLELPDPALNMDSPTPSPEAERRLRNTLPRRTRYRDVDGAAPRGAQNDEYRMEAGPAPHRTAIGTVLHRGSTLIRHASTANTAVPRQPVPLIRRILSHTGTIPDDEPDHNVIPLEHVRTREVEFFKWMDEQLAKVEDFYKLKENEAGQRLIVIREQLHEMRNRRISELALATGKRYYDAQGDTASTLHDLSALPTRQHSLERLPVVDESSRWKKPVEKALGNLNNLKLPGQKPGQNSNHLRDMPNSPFLPSEEGMQRAHGMDPARDYVRKPADHDDVPYRSAKRKLKLAMKEYYRGLELLKSYALLNRTAFRKINKKYDKAANAHPPLRYMSEKVNHAYFVKSDILDGYLHAVEDLYARYFERGNHKVAMGKLRSSNQKPGEYTGNAFRSGLMIGTGAVFGIQGLINARHISATHDDPDIQIQTSYLLQIYAGYLLALYLFAFFTLDCYVWAANKINYVFIFEFDPRSHIDWRQMAEFPAFFTLLLGLFVWVNFSDFGTPEMYLYYPVILIFVTLVVILMPAPVLFHHSRSWFAYSHWRLLLAGLYPVEFRDFFLGDMYCSLTYLTANIELFFCLYAHNWNDPPQCNSGHSRLLGFFTTLPGIWRAFQCLRRYKDTRALFPHMANFGKYTTTILYYIFLSLYRIHESYTNLALFITFATLNSLYSTLWDLGMDWSLLQPATDDALTVRKSTKKSYPGLRPTLSYKYARYYYAAMVFDVLLRFNWIFYAIFTHDTQHSTIASFFIAFSEANRRGVWTLFRVENEHAANVTRFKASRDVPLPYKLGNESEEVSMSLVHTGESGTTQAAAPGSGSAAAQDPGATADDEASRPGTSMSDRSAHGSLRNALAATLSRTRSRPSGTPGTAGTGGTASSTGVEEGPGMRRRRTLTRIFADAHTQDFEKKRRPGSRGGDVPNSERHGGRAVEGIEEELGQGSSDEEDSREEREHEDLVLVEEREREEEEEIEELERSRTLSRGREGVGRSPDARR